MIAGYPLSNFRREQGTVVIIKTTLTNYLLQTHDVLQDHASSTSNFAGSVSAPIGQDSVTPSG